MTTWKHRLTGPITKSDFRQRVIVISIPIILFTYLSFTMLRDSAKTIDDMAIAQGQLTYKEVVKEKYKGNNYRYTFVFRLNNMTQFLGIFLGSGESAIEEGELWNKKFAIGDNLKVYYDNNFITEHENITRLIRQIEKDNEIVYQTGTKGKRIIGLSSLGLDLLFIGMILWLRKRYKMSKSAV